MAYSEYQVTQGGLASDENGGFGIGTSDGPFETQTNCSSSGDGLTITNDDATGWTSSSIGDRICFDTAGLKDFARITNIVGDDLTVTPAVAFSLGTKTVNIGGAWATIAHTFATLQNTDFLNADGDGIRLNLKREGGTAYDEEDLQTNAFTAALPMVVEAYVSTPGDIDRLIDTDRALIEPSAPATARVSFVDDPSVIYRNIHFKIAGGGKNAVVFGGSGDNTVMENCKMHSADGHGLVGHFQASGVQIIRCDLSDNGLQGQQLRFGSDSSFVGGIVANNGGSGMQGSTFGLIDSCLIYGNGGAGIINHSSVNSIVISNNIIADNASDGIDIGSDAAIVKMKFYNNIIADNGGYGINSSVGAGNHKFGFYDYNCMHGNSLGALNDANINDDPQHNITDEPWTETTQATRTSTGDYTITAAMKAAGFPGTLADTGIVSNTGYVDLGALQHQDTGGGGGVAKLAGDGGGLVA
jgi:hypothetical protein